MVLSTPLVNPTADRDPTVLASSTDSSTAAWLATLMERSWWLASRRTSRIGGSICETSRPAAMAITAS
jgi:hypothetical protein